MENKNELFDEIKRAIKSSSNIIITGHKNLDMDAFGACLAISELCRYFKKESSIIKEDQVDELSVSRAIHLLKDKETILTYDQIKSQINKKSLLVVVDAQDKDRLQHQSLVDEIDNLIILDHHNIEMTNYQTERVKFVDSTCSSTCEIIADMTSYYGIKLSSIVSTIMLAGIKIDTNNFTNNTTDKTYRTASILIQNGADNKEVRSLLKQELKEYKKMQSLIAKVEIIDGIYAVVVAPSNQLYKKETLAKASDILLNFDNIEAAFTIGYIETSVVGISARSLGSINVGKIMEQLKGGGYITTGATELHEITLEEVREKLKGVMK